MKNARLLQWKHVEHVATIRAQSRGLGTIIREVPSIQQTCKFTIYSPIVTFFLRRGGRGARAGHNKSEE